MLNHSPARRSSTSPRRQSPTALLALVLALAWLTGCSGSRPLHLGHVNDQLAPCPDRPNCVSSFALADDPHFIAPLQIRGDADARWQALQQLIGQTDRAELISATPNYLHVEYRSRLMRFVDDVEFLRQPQTNLIHVRSASRLGYADFGVNRARIEALRTQWQDTATP